MGTAYGEVKQLTTEAADLPSVTTISCSMRGDNNVVVGGNVTSDGGATVTERGICWGRTSDPTIGVDSSRVFGDGTGAFTVCHQRLYLRQKVLVFLGFGHGLHFVSFRIVFLDESFYVCF